MQLGLQVHAEVNQAEDRETAGKHWRNLSDIMQSRTGVEGGTPDQLKLQGQNTEVFGGGRVILPGCCSHSRNPNVFERLRYSPRRITPIPRRSS